MNNIRLTVFDIFSYIIPGLCYLILTAYALEQVDLSDLMQIVSGLSIYSLLAYSSVAYLIGFASDSIANGLLTRLTNMLRGDFQRRVLAQFNEDNPECNVKEYHFAHIYAFANVKAPRARERADQFAAMSGLARNLSLVFFVFASLIAGISIGTQNTLDWFVTSTKIGLPIVVAIILMLRADTFRRWSHSHLLNVYYLLRPLSGANRDKLEERVEVSPQQHAHRQEEPRRE